MGMNKAWAAPQSTEVLIGQGWVSHTRPLQRGRASRNLKNAFCYPIFNLLIPIHISGSLEKRSLGNFLAVRPQDYLEGRAGSMETSIRAFLKENLDYQCDEIWLQTLPRLLGYAFNPVSFWFCFQNGALDGVLCEVNNTFGDRHFYFVKTSAPDAKPIKAKVFHVSPFFATTGHYSFEFEINDHSSEVHVRLHNEGEIKLDTCLRLEFRALKSASPLYLLKRYGWMTVMIVIRIHFQAFKLWLKGAEFFKRPNPPKAKVTQ